MMLPVYQQLAARAGTGPARELARELMLWHDAMVRHERRLATAGRGSSCTSDECPHTEARGLWDRATEIFGTEDARTLQYLHAAAGGTSIAKRPAQEGRAASSASTWSPGIT